MKVFIVEDSELFRLELEARLLALPDVTLVGHAATADSAVSGILATLPDVLTLDLDLTTGTGLDVLSAVRERCPGLITIVLTNHVDSTHRARCRTAGAQFFFDKSIQFEDAVSLCASLAGTHYSAAASGAA